MVQFLKRVLVFIKSYPGILFSLFLIIFIPLTLYYNTFFLVRTFQKSIDNLLQLHALMIENVMAEFFAEILDQPEKIQEKIITITKNNPQLLELRVLKEERGGLFSIVASKNPQEIGYQSSEPALALAFSQDQTIANLKTNQAQERSWSVIKPLYNKAGEKTGLLTVELSLKETDTLLAETLFKSYLIMVGAMGLSLILILHHTRLFEYVSLSKRLAELDRMKDNFIRMATHELQSPIINIRGYIEALGEELKNLLSPEQREMFWRASISAKNLADLVADILEVSRIEQGRLDLTPQLIEPSKIIQEVIFEFQNKAQEKNLVLEKEFPSTPYFIKANPKRLHQVLANLISNAIKYTNQGQIKVVAWIDNNKKRYLISVKDTGLGIPAEAQKRLFEKFYRVKTAQTANIPGTGLGLWISKELTERMGGQIFVESMEGVGSKFTITFPLAATS